MKFLTIVGTAREGRKSIGPAKAFDRKIGEKGHENTLYDLKEKDIPPLGNRTYMEDEEPVPEDIQELSEEVVEADCVVLVSPEYNHSIPGVLKNAIDYLYPEYDDKPFAYITVSGGGFGGVRALNHLHDITLEIGGFAGPDLPVSKAGSTVSRDGEFLEEGYEERFESFIKEVEGFVERTS